jgi:hypothetical protein
MSREFQEDSDGLTVTVQYVCEAEGCGYVDVQFFDDRDDDEYRDEDEDDEDDRTDAAKVAA